MGISLRLFATAFLAAWSFSTVVEASDAESVPGEYLIRMKPTARTWDVKGLEKSLNMQILRSLPHHRILVVQRPLIEQTSAALRQLRGNPQVELAEPNFIYRANKFPNDVEFGKLWGLKNTGQMDSRGAGVPGVDIDAERAWDITTGSDQVVVAVIDTGVDYTHPDLKENIWTNEAEANGEPLVDDDNNGYVDDIHGFNFVDVANPTSDPMDDNGHGSHCAGTIGAHGNDQIGIVGVSWKVKIMPVKFLSAAGGGTLEGAIQAIDYATQMKARIMSNSWGGGGESQLLREAIERADRAGSLFVAAAGNDAMNTDTDPHYPSGYPVDNVLAVAAVDNQGYLANFSNYGKKSVHVAAPGVNIFSSFPGGGYWWLSGTSMATPHVSGVAALMAAFEPHLKHTEIKKRITQTVRTLPSLRNKVQSNGMVNAYYALTNYQMPPDPNDPNNWMHRPLQISSAQHPYDKNANETYDIEIQGAKEFALYFEKFETEKKYDKVSFYDRNGAFLFEMTGYKDDSYSPIITGDWVRLVFTSDGSVQKHGFDITKASYR